MNTRFVATIATRRSVRREISLPAAARLLRVSRHAVLILALARTIKARVSEDGRVWVLHRDAERLAARLRRRKSS